MREIKFRAFNNVHKQMMPPDANPTMWDIGICSLPMQYTGLKDKNGQEIYEGDIVKASYGMIQPEVIGWSNESASFVRGNHHLLKSHCNDGCEVIGNIYENPELLSAPKQKEQS